MSDQPENRLEVTMAPEVEAGVYANCATVWHAHDGLVIDFAVITRPLEMEDDPDSGRSFVSVPTRVVSRVRLPPGQVFELMKALERQLTAFERETGQPV